MKVDEVDDTLERISKISLFGLFYSILHTHVLVLLIVASSFSLSLW